MSSLTAKKRKEAEDELKAAEKYLTKSMLRWKPDYMLASPHLEKAAEAYRSAKDYDLAKLTFLRAAKAQEKSNSSFRAATNTENAAKMLTELIKTSAPTIADRLLLELKECYEAVSSHYNDMGESGKAADALVKCAAFYEERKLSEKEIKKLYMSACSLLELQNKPHFAIETFRKTLGFLVRTSQYLEAIDIVKRQVILYQEMQQLANVHKCFVTLVILQLARGDVAAADDCFNKGIQDDMYLKSDECALADDLIRAYKLGNDDLLQTTIKKQGFHFLDHQIGRLVRKLTLFGTGMINNQTCSARIEKPQKSSGELELPSIAPDAGVAGQSMHEAGEFDFNSLNLSTASPCHAKDGDGQGKPQSCELPSQPSAAPIVDTTFDLT